MLLDSQVKFRVRVQSFGPLGLSSKFKISSVGPSLKEFKVSSSKFRAMMLSAFLSSYFRLPKGAISSLAEQDRSHEFPMDGISRFVLFPAKNP